MQILRSMYHVILKILFSVASLSLKILFQTQLNYDSSGNLFVFQLSALHAFGFFRLEFPLVTWQSLISKSSKILRLRWGFPVGNTGNPLVS